MRRQLLIRLFAVFVLATSNLLAVPARAQDQTADAFIKHLSSEMLNSIKTDPASRVGNVPAIIALVDAKLMPNVNFKRMTSSAAGPTWRQMTPEQEKRLQEEFTILLVRTYAGALSQIDDVTVAVKPLPQGLGKNHDKRRQMPDVGTVKVIHGSCCLGWG